MTALTPGQAVDVDGARQAVEASRADTSPAHLYSHCASLEYHVQTLLDLIGQLTGGQP